MVKISATTFIIISIILLVCVFFVFMIAGFFVSRPNANSVQTNIQNQTGNINGKDPMVTSAEEVYMSFLRDSDPVRGDGQADLLVLEFGDFECPYCFDMYSALIKVLADFDGQIGLVWKDFPNPMHLQARNAALSARCAQEQGKFWEYHDYLFVNQDELSRDMYNKIAIELGLNLEQFNTCLDSSKYIEELGQGLQDGQKLGVDGTPYLFIGNSKVDSLISEEELAGVIRKEFGKE
ncbi:hypothetical protein COV56_03635 [Candidatus Kuenenbacteria bacterium CG11_big_fil_rev_8_21_14_0_20_37_9]|uniref:Thioredoxin domain-containing protein n=2 Tax=Candidatus Kueneniibacteriota TaxID=1752740 RepID=A0A2M6XTE1_9BACT|nr:MAG: hypothetical protein AUJ29_01280 [Candidatus Kuenenbacteria bacterium CG1_02_38_13]PIR05286.1 MAG: hypothetical protein COV56_03635 [Candidatus Kuenenbacteria bacterium CG11_big_fil_rev_8_21_14_0_20_37_9]PIU10918.1 MAG: hypothetical protein COT27_00655 [Candidatus Kuenenbacteria bacterium CG08_land_8_20_14_0_20_37_23]